MGHKSRTHQSKFRGARRHGGGLRAPAGGHDGTQQEPKPFGRFLRHPGGTVPSAGRTPEEQLEFLDTMGLTAKKERVKLAKRIAEEKQNGK